jgi:hypothetical protein
MKNAMKKARAFALSIALFSVKTACIYALLLVSILSLEAAERVPVPLGHWSYPILEYFSTRQVLTINLQTKPVNREVVNKALEAIREPYVNGVLQLDPAEEDMLGSLFEEFYDVRLTSFRNTPRALFTTPSFSVKEASSITGRYASDDSDEATFNTLFWGKLGRQLVFSEQIRIVRKEQPGRRDTLGTRAWKDFRGTTPIALVTLPFPHFTLNVGRMTPWLGPGRFGTLLLSDNIPFFDGIHAEFHFKKLKLSSFFIIVNVDSAKYISGHRLELFNIWGTTVALSEFVIYSNRIEPGYLNPLLILYGEQFNRGDRDNVFWTLDVSRSLFGSNRIYAELLIDDFQYEPTPPAPNKVGVITGIHLVRPFSIPRFEVLLEYARIAKWTYSHKYPENTYSNYYLCLGHDLGPDADRLDITVREFLLWNIVPQLHVSYERHGEGRIYIPWESSTDPHPAFPSGTVSTKKTLDLSVFVKPFPSSEINMGWETFRIENKYNVQDWVEQDNAFFIDLMLTF